MKQLLIITIAFLYSFVGLSQDNKYLPTSNGEVVKHSHYTLSYVEKYEHAEWVAYELDSIETIKIVKLINPTNSVWIVSGIIIQSSGIDSIVLGKTNPS